jgi:peptidoglycan/LPS O-acetylase OafA/YrhL
MNESKLLSSSQDVMWSSSQYIHSTLITLVHKFAYHLMINKPIMFLFIWQLFQNAPAMLLANGPVIVDGFFALSGILLAYPLLSHLAKTERISIVMPIFVRFIR